MEEEIRWRINWLVAVLGTDQEQAAWTQLRAYPDHMLKPLYEYLQA